MTSRPTIQPLRQKAIQQTVDFMGDKNPFSIYDFLGYLFPGIVAIFVVFIVRQSVVSPYYDLFDCLHVGNIMKMIREEINLNWLEASGIVNYETRPMAVDALKWAAYTYVIAAIGSIATLLYYIGLARRD